MGGQREEKVKKSDYYTQKMNEVFNKPEPEGSNEPEYGSDGQRIEKEKKGLVNPFRQFINQMLDKTEEMIDESNKTETKPYC